MGAKSIWMALSITDMVMDVIVAASHHDNLSNLWWGRALGVVMMTVICKLVMHNKSKSAPLVCRFEAMD